jgi:hydroxymethylbilane synthase
MIRIATRRSNLARWQADWVAQQLTAAGHAVELVLLSSEGDVNREIIDGSQSVGLFTKRIQQAVLEEAADLAVHSLKDLPTQLDTGLSLIAVPVRAAVADCLVTTGGLTFEQLPQEARIGTGSRRRAAQLRHKRPDLRIEPIRGNVETRLAKIETEAFAAVVLAEAGLRRLELFAANTVPLDTSWMLPAPGQGALGIEASPGNSAVIEAVRETLDDAATHAAVVAERAVLRTLRAGCLAPVSALGRYRDDRLELTAAVLSVDGRVRLGEILSHDCATGDYAAADALGVAVAESLLAQGAGPLVAAAR